MIRKKITTGSLLALLALGYSACNENNIDLQPLSPTEASFFTQEGDFEKGTFAIYSKMADFYTYRSNQNNPMLGFWQLPGDDITSTGNYAFENFSINPSVNLIGDFYRTCYQLINRANTLLQKLDAEQGVIKTAGLKNRLRGEVLFLRGYANYLLANYYGTSPLITERIIGTDAIYQPSSADGALLDQAIKDLTEAATLLPASWPVTFRGRVTKNSANGLLGKALVVRGSLKKSPADFTAAIAAFDNITGVALVANYNDNFDVKTENNSESLFEYQSGNPPGFDNVWVGANGNDEFAEIGSYSVYWGYYENHYALFGNPRYIGTQKLLDAFEPADPRIKSTIDPANKNFLKYWATGDQKSNSGNTSLNNPRILRYADVLLLKAEAVLESGGSTAGAIDLINQVRTRARNMVPGGTVPANYATTTTDKAQVFSWIMAERLRELAGEDHIRWIDLRRWHIAGKINLGAGFNWSSVRTDLNFDPAKHLLYPIPTSEIDLNPNVKQNPGY